MSPDVIEQLLDARRVIAGVCKTQRGSMSDLALIALQEVALELGDIVFELREAEFLRRNDA